MPVDIRDKATTLLSIDSSTITLGPNGHADMTIDLSNNPIYNQSLNAKVAFLKGNLWFSTFNIDANLWNNSTLRYSADSGGSYSILTIPDGNYNIEDLSSYVSDETSGGVSFQANYATGKIFVSLLAGYYADFATSTGLATFLGFTNILVTSSQYGANIGDVSNGVSAWQLHLSLIQGRSFSNGSSSDVIYQFTPRTASFASMEVEPINPIFIGINDAVVTKFRVYITDQRGNLLDLNDQPVVLLFAIAQ